MDRCASCFTVLVGFLQAVPEIKMDGTGSVVMMAEVVTRDQKNYSVIIREDAALLIKNFGFVNLQLWVEGCPALLDGALVIVAETVKWMTDIGSNNLGSTGMLCMPVIMCKSPDLT